jgi:hypothetical protein
MPREVQQHPRQHTGAHALFKPAQSGTAVEDRSEAQAGVSRVTPLKPSQQPEACKSSRTTPATSSRPLLKLCSSAQHCQSESDMTQAKAHAQPSPTPP